MVVVFSPGTWLVQERGVVFVILELNSTRIHGNRFLHRSKTRVVPPLTTRPGRKSYFLLPSSVSTKLGLHSRFESMRWPGGHFFNGATMMARSCVVVSNLTVFSVVPSPPLFCCSLCNDVSGWFPDGCVGDNDVFAGDTDSDGCGCGCCGGDVFAGVGCTWSDGCAGAGSRFLPPNNDGSFIVCGICSRYRPIDELANRSLSRPPSTVAGTIVATTMATNIQAKWMFIVIIGNCSRDS